MSRSLATSLRAHLALLATSILIAALPLCALDALLGLFDADGFTLSGLSVLVLAALPGMVTLWLLARQAFRTANATGYVRLHVPGEHMASITPDCRHSWFVRLYLELKGYECIDRV